MTIRSDLKFVHSVVADMLIVLRTEWNWKYFLDVTLVDDISLLTRNSTVY